MSITAAAEYALMLTRSLAVAAGGTGLWAAQCPGTGAGHPGRPGPDQRPDRRRAAHQRPARSARTRTGSGTRPAVVAAPPQTGRWPTMSETCDRCGPAVGAGYRVDRVGELYLCGQCASRHWRALSAQGGPSGRLACMHSHRKPVPHHATIRSRTRRSRRRRRRCGYQTGRPIHAVPPAVVSVIGAVEREVSAGRWTGMRCNQDKPGADAGGPISLRRYGPQLVSLPWLARVSLTRRAAGALMRW